MRSSRPLPREASLSCRLSPVSSGSISTSSVKSISPVSSPASICIVVSPVFLSPSRIAHCIGAAPRHLGRSEACTLMQPYFGNASISSDKICPNATTTITSQGMSLRIFINSGSFTRCGVYTGMSCDTASSFTGVKTSFPLRPLALSGCVITAVTSCSGASISPCRTGTAKSGVPIKITFI